jgi:hypothetical protein
MNMEPFEAYSYYLAIKLHFESDSYDAPKYNYKTSAKPSSFWKRKDKYHFAKLGRKHDKAPDIINFYVSQFIEDRKWVGDMMTDEDNYSKWQKRMQSLSYTFQNDINTLAERVETFEDLFAIETHPYIVKEYMSGTICLETVVILNKLVKFMDRADSVITETILWPDVSRKIRKYNTFVNINTNNMKKIVLRAFTK